MASSASTIRISTVSTSAGARARDDPDRSAEHHGQARRGKPDDEREPKPGDDAGQHVTTQLVRSQQVPRPRREQGTGEEVSLRGRIRQRQRPDQRQQRQQHERNDTGATAGALPHGAEEGDSAGRHSARALRIEHGVKHVTHEAARHDRRGGEHRRAHEQGIVARGGGARGEASQTLPREHLLHEDGAYHEDWQPESEEGQHGRQRRSPGVPPYDAPVREAAGARRRDVRLPQRLEHRGALVPHARRDADRRQRECRQDEVPQPVQGDGEGAGTLEAGILQRPPRAASAAARQRPSPA